MELKVDIGFEQLMQAIKQLPEAKIMQLKAELAGKKSTANSPAESINLQELLLNGPVMNDEQYQGYKDLRKRFNQWRAK